MSSPSRAHHHRRHEEDLDSDRQRDRHRHSSSSRSHRDRDRSHRGERREPSRSRSPQSSHRRHHKDDRIYRNDESRDEKKERRRRERQPDRGEDDGALRYHRRSGRGDTERREDREKRARSGRDANKIIDENKHDTNPHTEMFTDLDTTYQSHEGVSQIPTSESLALRSQAAPTHTDDTAPLPAEPATISTTQRDDWMLGGHVEEEAKGDVANGDYFSTLGGAGRVKQPKADKPNPDQLKVSSREINTQFAQGKHLDEYEKREASASQPGGPGHQWRMMKLRRVYEAAEDEGRAIEDVALERYGTMEAFNEARMERQFLDDQHGKRQGGGQREHSGGERRGPVHGSSSSSVASRPVSRQSFRKPGESSLPSTPQAAGLTSALSRQPQTSVQRSGIDSSLSSKPSTPIPSVFTPNLSRAGSKLRHLADEQERTSSGASTVAAAAVAQDGARVAKPPLSAAELNKLFAKVLRAEMMESSDAPSLRKQLEEETARAASAGGDQSFGDADGIASHRVGGEDVTDSDMGHIQVLPTLDARGRLYDVGKSKASEEDKAHLPGNRRKSRKFETRDAKTGELVRYNADDDEQTLQDLVRQERFGAGSADQKNLDAEMATRIVSDQAFKDNVDYMDDNVERLARKKVRSDAMKRQFAIQDFAKTKKALDSCAFCWQDEGARPPAATVISSGTRSYLALPPTEQLTDGHCLIVPIQHNLSSLEADDDTWEEIKNFMKCLMQMAHAHDHGVVFYETVKSIKQQRHTVIEAVPLELSLFQELPGYFKQSIMSIGDEWSQHKKVIEFSSSRSFRRSMVPQLPYFMIQWDYKGEKGYGHVIEDTDRSNAADGGGGDEEGGLQMTESSRGGGDFPAWFAAEIIGNLLDYEPRRWRKPRRLHSAERDACRSAFKTLWKPFDWTSMLGV